ncbi:hypothetical protein VI817_000025 [Penicillium citrinum]|nr:hypothetical protein VI817_000025 [Penicillium citrinum]
MEEIQNDIHKHLVRESLVAARKFGETLPIGFSGGFASSSTVEIGANHATRGRFGSTLKPRKRTNK